MISRDTIDRIFEAARIEEVVGDFVQLKKAGSSLKGYSPWANEKTPSFFVSPAKGIFKDFSSGKGGNAVSFLMELESMSYPEALRYLADKYKIEVEDTAMDADQLQEISMRESLALVNKFAAEYFERSLWESEEGKSIGLSYFRERGFTDVTIRKFALGFSFAQNDAFFKSADAAGHNKDHLKTIGLVKEGEFGDYDFFRGRVMFPIRNVSGRVIAFAGRALRSDSKVKYLNSPESELYDKSNSLYGIYESKKQMLAEDTAFLVEGYTDVIALHQAGVGYAVASSGTSLTTGQIKLIKRYTQNVSLLYDGDPAGVKAALRGIDLLLEEGMNVKVLLFPDGHDPDSFARSVSSTELARYLKEEATDFTDFMLKVLLEDAGNDPIKKATATRRMVESLALIGDHIARSIYVERTSKMLDVPEQAIYNELNKILRKKQQNTSRQDTNLINPALQKKGGQDEPFEDPEPFLLEKEIARILLSYGQSEMEVEIESEVSEKDETISVPIAEYILHDLFKDQIEFHSPLYAKILNSFRDHFVEKESFPGTDYFVNDPDPTFSQAIAGMVSSPYELSENWELQHKIFTETEDKHLKRTVLDPLMRLKLKRIKSMMIKLDASMKTADNEEDLTLLLREKIKIDQMKIEVSKFFGTTII